MTTVTVRREGEEIAGICVEGHAGFANQGQDIVCAAASILMTTCINAMETVAGVKASIKVDERAARMEMDIPSGLSTQTAHDAQVILRTALQGFTDMALAYPKHLKIIVGRKSSC